jgi:hypothetical protein
MKIPETRWLIFILLLSAVLPVSYFINMLYPPDGHVFAGRHIDDGMNMAVMKSYLWGYRDPFMRNTTIFNNPVPGPPYLFATLGAVSAVSQIAPLVLIFIMTFVFAAAYLIAMYNIIGYFSPDKFERDTGFLFFTVATGVGGLIYLALMQTNLLPGASIIHLVVGAPIFSERALYIIISLAMGYTALMLLFEAKTRNDFILFTATLGISILVYPFFGIVFFALGGMFCLLNHIPIKKILFSLLFFIPWVFSYLNSYGRYSSAASPDYYNFFAFLANGGFTLLFAAIAIYSDRKEKKYVFLTIWAVVFAILVFLPNPIIPRTRFTHLVWAPFAILAAKGLSQFKSKKKIAIVAIAISIPSVMVGFALLYNLDAFYLTQNEFDALQQLKGMPQGNVLSSFEIGAFVPEYAEKMSLLGERQETPELAENYAVFFSNASSGQKQEILRKYDITYVFYSDFEKKTGTIDPALDIQKIYENSEVSIYRIKP